MMELKKISDFEWEIPKSGRMIVPGKIFSSENNLKDIKKDKTLEQIKNVACLPGIIGFSFAMPDVHQGYGFPIGGVAAFDLKEGVISPGGVGYDINCSVRLLKTNLKKEDIEKDKERIIDSLFKGIPSGVGRAGRINLKERELTEILKKGALWAIENGYGTKEDLEFIEEGGCMKQANPDFVTRRAKSRGIGQLGTLGAGNHFLEVQYVDKILNKEVSRVLGLEEGQVCIMIHCGSRGLGHQVASDYILEMERHYGFNNLPDRELICAPIGSELGEKYFSAMSAAANFGFANKQVISFYMNEIMRGIFPNFISEVVYEVCHNIAKFEKHEIKGKRKEVLVIRKGATRSFGPNREELPKKYKKVGQPIILPGSMGTSSYVLVGTNEAEKLTFGSTAHGAGRLRSRISISKEMTVQKVESDLKNKGIELRSGSRKGIIEEAPEAYKDIDEIVRISHEAKIGNLVARLKPLCVIKG